MKKRLQRCVASIIFGGLVTLTFGCISAMAQTNSGLLVGNVTDSSIKRYDGTTGAFVGNFVAPGSGGLNLPTYFIFGPDGNLYVSSNRDGSVKRYNGKTGAYIDDFVPAVSGDESLPYGLAFGPDGNLYVSMGAVKRYNGATGAYINDFVPFGTGTGALLAACG